MAAPPSRRGGRGERNPGADVGRGKPSPGADVGGVEPRPSAHVAAVSAVPEQMWQRALTARAADLWDPADSGEQTPDQRRHDDKHCPQMGGASWRHSTTRHLHHSPHRLQGATQKPSTARNQTQTGGVAAASENAVIEFYSSLRVRFSKQLGRSSLRTRHWQGRRQLWGAWGHLPLRAAR
jgi:hypothetical protein